MTMALIEPDWPVADPVRAMATTRAGGVSQGPWTSFNLGEFCGDEPATVAENRRRLARLLPASPCWLSQVHGTRLIHLDDWKPGIKADAAWTDRPGQVAVIQSADCLPILMAHARGDLVVAVHAGWRGLAEDIISQTVAALPGRASDLLAWIGPAISAPHYEVGVEVRDQFVGVWPTLATAFAANPDGNFQADLKAIARWQLADAGVGLVRDSGLCTAADPARFYSYRRDHGQTGRQASLIWLESS